MSDTGTTLFCPDCGEPFKGGAVNLATGNAWCGPCSKLYRIEDLQAADESASGELPNESPETSPYDSDDSSEAHSFAKDSASTFDETHDASDEAAVDEETEPDETDGESFDEDDDAMDAAVGPPITPVNVVNPPKGAWFEMDIGGFRCGAAVRSPAGWFLLGFATFWLGMLGAILGINLADDNADAALLLMLSPFLLIGAMMLFFALYMRLGRIVLHVNRNESFAFNGVGPIGRRRHFDWDQVTAIKYEVAGKSNGVENYRLVLEGPEPPVKFGGFVPQSRLSFLAGALAQSKRRR